MLWYKAWLETRPRFLISLIGILVLCSYSVYHGNSLGDGKTNISWYYFVLQQSHTRLCILWVVAVTLLMMGGLLREKAVGASDFTLALPVRRERLMVVRIATGLLEALALVIIPWGVMFLIAITTGRANSVFQAVFHVLLLAGGGLVFFALALLISSLVEGEYTAPAVSLGVMLAIAMALGDKPLSIYSPWNFIVGPGFSSDQTIPWLHLLASVLFAVLLAAISIKVIQKREF